MEYRTAPASVVTAATVVDRLAVDDVMFRYLECLDRHDVEGFVAVFVPTGRITVDYRTGVEEFVGTERIREFVQGRGGNAFHITTDSSVVVDDDRATRWSRFAAFPSAPTDGQPVVNWVGRTIDEFVRTDSGWRLQDRWIWVVQGGGSPSWDGPA